MVHYTEPLTQSTLTCQRNPIFISLGSIFPGGTWKLANVSNDTCSTCLSRVRPGSNSNDPATFDYWSETTVHDYEDSSGDNSRDSFYHVGTMLSSDFVPGFALSYIEQMKQHRAFPFATLDGGKSFFPIPVRNSQLVLIDRKIFPLVPPSLPPPPA